MSLITDIMIVALAGERKAIDYINNWADTADPERQQHFERIDMRYAGGSKLFTLNVYALSGNYYPWYELVEILDDVPWNISSCVTIIIDGETEGSRAIYKWVDPPRRFTRIWSED